MIIVDDMQRKKIGFLSFGHWAATPGSQVRTASEALLQSIDLAVAAEELGADGAHFRVPHFARSRGSTRGTCEKGTTSAATTTAAAPSVRTRVKAATVFMIRPSSQTTPERARYCFVNSLDNAEKS